MQNKTELFAKRLAALMKAARLSQYAVAKRLGVSNSTVLGWYRGDTIPQRRTAAALGELFGVSPVWLLTGEGTKEASEADRVRVVDRRKVEAALSRAERALADLRREMET